MRSQTRLGKHPLQSQQRPGRRNRIILSRKILAPPWMCSNSTGLRMGAQFDDDPGVQAKQGQNSVNKKGVTLATP